MLKLSQFGSRRTNRPDKKIIAINPIIATTNPTEANITEPILGEAGGRGSREYRQTNNAIMLASNIDPGANWAGTSGFRKGSICGHHHAPAGILAEIRNDEKYLNRFFSRSFSISVMGLA
jgi:hypothetical protein